ncbi:phage antirepressor [Clostridium neonatale]|uniref:phage antirepressor n=1 Tax=Clostridium neonatale TaxID=137838 RepID=UPI00291B7389|nr:anti-repressor protein [Clostridium neonatale]
MNNQLQVFKNEQFGKIRMIEINDKPYFVAIDIAKALGYKDTTNAIKQHCRWVVKHKVPHPQSKNKTLEVNVIPEGDMYRLITNSELPSAEKFESWVFDEVLPSIRKTGGYLGADNNMTDEEIMAKALMVAQNTINKKNELLQAKEKELIEVKADLNTKNNFINQIGVSQNSLKVVEVAQIASKKGIKIGQNKLWEKLRAWGMIKKNSKYDPKQEYIEREYFEVVEGTKENSKGVFTYKTTRVLGKGQVYIIKRLLEEQKEAM